MITYASKSQVQYRLRRQRRQRPCRRLKTKKAVFNAPRTCSATRRHPHIFTAIPAAASSSPHSPHTLYEKYQRRSPSSYPARTSPQTFMSNKKTHLRIDRSFACHAFGRYKNGKVEGKAWGPWCGSSLHFLELMS